MTPWNKGLSRGTDTTRTGNFWFTYTHHCKRCRKCKKVYNTFTKQATCCGKELQFLTNEQALKEKLFHDETSDCRCCKYARCKSKSETGEK